MSTTPKTNEQIVREAVEGHVNDAGSALDPYLLRATASRTRMKNEDGGLIGQLPPGLAELMGITPEKIEETAEESMAYAAVAELMTDLMHFCKARGINFGSVGRAAYDRYQEEMSHAADVLMYGKDVDSAFFRAPEENPLRKPEDDGHDVGWNTAADGDES